jgi:hypothetical protein
MGLVTLYCVWRLAREWYDHETALLATALVAWNPLIITYAKQPMSDVAATMWISLGLVLAVRASAISGFCSGLAAGFAMGVVAQMVVQNYLFGSLFSTGYGSAANLFSLEHLDNNLGVFARHGWTVMGPLFLPGLVLGLIAARPEPRLKPIAIFAGVALPYLFYLPFDHWETLRFLLPGLVPLTMDQREHSAGERGVGQSAQRIAKLVRTTENAAMGFHCARSTGDVDPRAAVTRRNGLRRARG